MAEGLLNSLGDGRFKAYSADSQPAGAVNPIALTTLKKMHLPSDGYRSKDWSEFAVPGAPELDFVFTVCDNAAGEVCPVWPGQPMTAHWGVPDPAAFEGSDEQKAKLFWDTAVTLKRRIELMLALPLQSLDRLSLQRELKDIGTR
jgi:arsenate reductase